MEKNFYQDNFEQLLKETTDNFRMYPSKRVWHSIYNDLHPGRKWPSLAIWLLLITSVVFVGVANRNHTVDSKNIVVAQVVPAASTAKQALLKSTATLANTNATIDDDNYATGKISLIFNDVDNHSIDIDTRSNPLNEKRQDQRTQALNVIAYYNSPASIKSTGGIAGENYIDELDASSQKKTSKGGLKINTGATAAVEETAANEPGKDKKLIIAVALKEEANAKLAMNNKIAEKAWMEDYAFHNKPAASKWRSRTSYELYATPSIGYRTISKNASFNPVVNNSLVVNAAQPDQQNYDDAVSQAAAVNMELGGNILYSVSKKLNLKIGVQVNYTNYNINAYELKHPTMTTLQLNDINTGLPVSSSRSTSLANNEGVYSKKLNNNTYQVSIPIGADFKIAGNRKLKWFAGATIQPTYITGGNSYLISADLKNYVADNSLMRKWNLNAGVETFISYQTRSGIILHAGPQLRYQFMSTYSKQYTYDEKLYNIGVKIGIITNF